MDTETVLAQILPKVTEVLQALVEEAAQMDRPTLSTLEAQTQAVLPRIGQVVLQAGVAAQGSGLDGPERPCACGGVRRRAAACGGVPPDHDRRRPPPTAAGHQQSGRAHPSPARLLRVSGVWGAGPAAR